MSETQIEKTAFILGAGFSKNSELPVQSDFSSLLFSNDFNTELDHVITKTLKEFLKNVFRWSDGEPLPSFEDIFTCIDLSESKNKNLGINYDPEALRSIQKMIIYRVFSVLDHRFKISPDIKKLLDYFIKPIGEQNASFIVLNWDIVLEKHLRRLGLDHSIDYCCLCQDWVDPNNNQQKKIQVCKMHGSSNWVYCKNCKTLFFELYSKLSLHIKAGLSASDISRFDEAFTNQKFLQALGANAYNRECRNCGNIPSTHIATFSYIKSFDTRIYSSIWAEAERLLADSDRWVFIGYSFPEADYEIKHLLKLAQLRYAHRNPSKEKKIDVVVWKDKNAKEKFSSFFGKNNITFFNEGLNEYVKKVCV